MWGAALTLSHSLMGCVDEYTRVKHCSPLLLHDPRPHPLTECVSLIQRPAHFLGRKQEPDCLDYWDVTPHSPSLMFPLLPSILTRTQVMSQNSLSSFPPSAPSTPLLSSPHPLSLYLVCLLSQLLSKKRGLFRIHAGRKQRYPRQRACARGTLNRHHPITWLLTPIVHTFYSLCLKTLKNLWASAEAW